MARPFTEVDEIWSAAAASATVTYPNARFSPHLVGQMKLMFILSAFSGTLDFQASADGSTWINIPYYQSDIAPVGSLATAQLSYTTSSVHDSYVVPGGPWKHFQIVMTRTAGTITAWLEAYEHESFLVARAAAVENLVYSPDIQDSGDLEAATKTITVTAEAGTEDYSVALTIAAPASSKMAVTRLTTRLSVTIDSFTGATILNYRIKRGGTSIGTGTISTGSSTGNKLVVNDVTTGTLTGAATYTIFFWVDQITNCIISVVELWVGVGVNGGADAQCLTIDDVDGLVNLGWNVVVQGTGNMELQVHSPKGATWLTAAAGDDYDTVLYARRTAATADLMPPDASHGLVVVVPSSIGFMLGDMTVATDIACIDSVRLTRVR